MAAFPKYSKYICNTYPDNGFVAGPQSCVLPSGDVKRSRLAAGGSFYRSVETGATSDVNNISLTCTVTFRETVGDIDFYDVVFDYTDDTGAPQPTITVEQRYDTLNTIYTLNGITQLRAALSGNSIVRMPTDDSGTAGSGYTSVSDADHISSFSGTMSGGLQLPVSGGSPVDLDTIRTGPTYTLAHIAQSDTAENGDWVDINAISEWDGSQWTEHPSSLHEPFIDGNGDVVVPHPDCPNPPEIP